MADTLFVIDRVYSGARLIARKLGCSEKTVYRIAAAGELRTFRTGHNNSPLRCRASELERFMTTARGGQ